MQVTINIRPELNAVCDILQVSPVEVTQLLLEKQLEESDNTLLEALIELTPLDYKDLNYDVRLLLSELRITLRNIYLTDTITVDQLHERIKVELEQFTTRWKTVINHNSQSYEP